MIKQMLLLALFSCCAQVIHAQTAEFLKILNDRGFYRPYVQWLEEENKAHGYLRQIHEFSVNSMKGTLETVKEEHERAKVILKAREEILGTKLVKKLDEKPKQKDLDKQDAILAKRFNDTDRIKEAFKVATQTDRLCTLLENNINREIANRRPAEMPQGALKQFNYSNGNGFSGYRLEVNLEKKEGANILHFEERRMRFEPEEETEQTYDVVVDDSVFEKVRKMVEEGKLYDVGSSYMPDYMIMDASNWSLSISFEKGSISSSGYASGPDHSDTLREILQYLNKVYDELKPKEPQTEKTE